MKHELLVLAVLLSLGRTTFSQELLTPEASQKAGITQRIGLTDISISYHSPLVKGRVIWGEVIPFGEVWRAGANENTVITFSTPVTVEGKPLPAGTYGLHMLPRKDNWTIIFSSNSASWGSYFYQQAEDVLRVDVRPDTAPMQEWLSYSFTDPKASSVKVELRWEKIAVGFIIQVDLNQTVLASMRQELRGVKYYSWEGPHMAADYSLRNKTNVDEALVWADHSISMKETFSNLNVKAGLLELKGDKKSAEKIRQKALLVADEQQLNAHGYQLLAQGQKQEAIEVFRINVKRYPDSWNVYDSLADGYEQNGNMKDALTNYKIALSKAPEAQKKRITTQIEKIQKKT